MLASLGCGNPTALAELKEGEVVLDLGSGGGIDVLLSAKRVGPTGKAYGLDMTDEMLALARRNAAEAGAENVEFLKGDIEAIPLPDASVDVIISNCVINLSADKAQVLREAYRVLKPGGRFAVSDVVVRGDVPAEVRRSMELWVGCVAGALEEAEFETLLREAGLRGAEPGADAGLRAGGCPLVPGGGGAGRGRRCREAVEGRFMSAFVRGARRRRSPVRPGGADVRAGCWDPHAIRADQRRPREPAGAGGGAGGHRRPGRPGRRLPPGRPGGLRAVAERGGGGAPGAGIPGVAGNYDSTTATDYEHCGCRYEDPRQEELSHMSYAWTRAHVVGGDEALAGRAPVPHRHPAAGRPHRPVRG